MTMMLSSIIIGLAVQLHTVVGQCFQDPDMNTEWAKIINEDDTSTTFSIEGSCCQETVCGIPCAEPTPAPAKGFAIAVMVAICIFVVVGFATIFLIKGEAENFFVGGRSFPLWVVTATLASQSIDSNAILGASTLSYRYHFWDGAVIPLGLGISLILNSIFLARHINKDYAFTLPDIFAKRYGKVVEILASLCSICSFLCLLAGNLVGMGAIISYVLDINQEGAIWLACALVTLYTVAGGMVSVAYTDVMQAAIGWTGCCALAFYMIANAEPAPPPSIGFPDYVYPDDETCQMYDGVPCTNDETACCYNTEKWCPDDDNCTADNGAYPFGDQRVFSDQMTNAHSLYPFPNAVVWDWATIFVLGFGNLAALDFQARCMASKTPKIATIGCAIAGCLTFVVGIPFAYLGAITRVHYGPDSVHASFETDSCHIALGLPTCALWLPDDGAVIKLLTNVAPAFLGGWCLIGIVSASMSTCDGAILAMGTVLSHNVMRNCSSFLPFGENLITEQNLLMAARISSVPMAIISALIASFYRSTHSAGATGYLLIVAFDVMLATCVVPLFGCFYTKTPSPLAALCSILTGVVVRIVLEFALPKDGWLIMPFPGDEFLDYGSAASTAFPTFFDVNTNDMWNPAADQCEQPRFNDWTGVDSLAAPIAGLIVFVVVQWLERDAPLMNFKEDGVMAPYIKESQKINEFIEYSQRHLNVDASTMSRKDVLAEMEKHESFRRKDWDIHESAKAKDTEGKETKELEDSDEAIDTAKEVEVVDVKKDDNEPDDEFLKSSGFAAPQSQEASE